jgi:hypothetical protein
MQQQRKFITSYNAKTNDIPEQYGCTGREIDVWGMKTGWPSLVFYEIQLKSSDEN